MFFFSESQNIIVIFMFFFVCLDLVTHWNSCHYTNGLLVRCRGFDSQESAGNFVFTTASRPSFGLIQPPPADADDSFPRDKRVKSCPNRSLPFNSNANAWSYATTLQYVFVA